MIRRRSSVNRSGAHNFRSMDNGTFSDVYFAFDFLGTSIDWYSSNYRSSSRLAMVEKTTRRGKERISLLWQTLTHNKRRKRSIVFLLYCFLHQGFHRWKLECCYCVLDFGLCCKFNDYNTSLDCNHLWDSYSNRGHLVDEPRNEEEPLNLFVFAFNFLWVVFC